LITLSTVPGLPSQQANAPKGGLTRTAVYLARPD